MTQLPDISGLLGKPYLYGACGPDAFSCIGLCVAVHRMMGHPAKEPAEEGSEDQWETVPLEAARPGDIAVIDAPPYKLATHVGLVWEGGKLLHVRGEGGVALSDFSNYTRRIPHLYRWRGDNPTT